MTTINERADLMFDEWAGAPLRVNEMTEFFRRHLREHLAAVTAERDAREQWVRDVESFHDIPSNGTNGYGAIAQYIKTVKAERDALKSRLDEIRENISEDADDFAKSLIDVGPVDAAWLQSVGFEDGRPILLDGGKTTISVSRIENEYGCRLTVCGHGLWSVRDTEFCPPLKSRSDVLTLMRLLGCGKEST